jgi:hypothetical protein
MAIEWSSSSPALPIRPARRGRVPSCSSARPSGPPSAALARERPADGGVQPAAGRPAVLCRPFGPPAAALARERPADGGGQPARPGAGRAPSGTLAPRTSPVTARYPTQPQRCNIVAVLTAMMLHCGGYPGTARRADAGEQECCGTPGACGTELRGLILIGTSPRAPCGWQRPARGRRIRLYRCRDCRSRPATPPPGARRWPCAGPLSRPPR